jgi:hypothetical protein
VLLAAASPTLVSKEITMLKRIIAGSTLLALAVGAWKTADAVAPVLGPEARPGRPASLVQGRITQVDPARREFVVMGTLTVTPSRMDRTTRLPGTTVIPPAAFDPNRINAPQQARDTTGSGRTGNAPLRQVSYTLALSPTAIIVVNGRQGGIADIRPDFFARVVAHDARAEVKSRVRPITPGTLPAEGTSEVERSKGQSVPGTSGSNSAASPDRYVGMIADRVEVFAKPPADIPRRPDPPKSGPLGVDR